MKHIIAFAGSNSKASINKQLVTYASSLIDGVDVVVLDLNDFELPLFGVDLEREIGHPENAHKFVKLIRESDGVLLSLAEHNGAYSAVFKNLLDWMSRIEGKMFLDKTMLLMATSDGARGGASVLAMAADRLPRHGANVVATFSLPQFSKNFSEGKIINPELKTELENAIIKFKNNL